MKLMRPPKVSGSTPRTHIVKPSDRTFCGRTKVSRGRWEEVTTEEALCAKCEEAYARLHGHEEEDPFARFYQNGEAQEVES